MLRNKNTDFIHGFDKELNVHTISLSAFIKEDNGSLYSPHSTKRKETFAKFIPYYAFANRGENDMQVWTLIE